jgi:CRP-like cAMP-binding protein
MAEGKSSEHSRLIRKMETITALTEPERAALSALPMRIKDFAEDTDLVREGDAPQECCLILDGFVCRYKLLGQGQRQIFSFHLPGDIADLQCLQLGVMDHSVGSLAPGRCAYIPHAALRDLTDRFPGIAAAFWRDTLIDAAVFREWLAGVGRRTAHQRIAHLICEVCVRLRSLKLIDDHVFDMPVTQAELGDSLGLSTVHVNRVLQDLRRGGLITSKGRRIVIEDWPRLQEAGDFDPAYLHLRAPQGR